MPVLEKLQEECLGVVSTKVNVEKATAAA